MKDAQFTTISMRKETLLVIFEFLARSYGDWRKSGVAPVHDLSDESFVFRDQTLVKELLSGG